MAGDDAPHVARPISNAIFHAMGKRVRSLPITLDKLL
jgi:CO/xanthine dehydrogenase Mo-binding subunit